MVTKYHILIVISNFYKHNGLKCKILLLYGAHSTKRQEIYQREFSQTNFSTIMVYCIYTCYAYLAIYYTHWLRN